MLLSLMVLTLVAPVPKATATVNLLVTTTDGHVHLVSEKGNTSATMTLEHSNARFVRLSPDGKLVAYVHRADAKKQVATLAIQAWGEAKAKVLKESQHISALFWQPTGEGLVACGLDIEKGNKPQNARHACWLTWKTMLKDPDQEFYMLDGEYRLIGMTSDAKQFIALRTFDPKPVGQGVLAPKIETWLLDANTLKGSVALPDDADVVPIGLLQDDKTWLVRKTDSDRVSRIGLYSKENPKFVALPDQEKDPFTNAVSSTATKRIYASKSSTLYTFDLENNKAEILATFKSTIREMDVK